MEVGDLVSALEKTLSLLRESESSAWAGLSVEEVIRQLEGELDRARNSQPIDLKQLGLLFGPAGSLQEISIDNGWANGFLEISKIMDRYTKAK